MQPTPQHSGDDSRDDGSDPHAGSHTDDRSPVTGSTAASVVPDLGVLDELEGRAPHEHVAVYERVHAQLQSALSEIDDA